MEQICGNCLNAYRSTFDGKIYCVNREWEQQFNQGVRITVILTETCGTWQRRNAEQPALKLNKPIQLRLF